jgi:predicted ester cyclase
MSLEANKAIVRRYLEDASAASLEDVNAIDEVAAPDITVISPPHPPIHGLENVKKATEPFFRALAELKVTVEDMIAEDDRVAGRWTFEVTTKSSVVMRGGIALPGGKKLTWTSIGMFRVRDGKVVEERTHVDWVVILRQVGIVGILRLMWGMLIRGRGRRRGAEKSSVAIAALLPIPRHRRA